MAFPAARSENQRLATSDQFVLRLPPALAARLDARMRQTDASAASSSAESGDTFTVGNVELPCDGRHGSFTFDGQEYACILVDLPCITETLKTMDTKAYYKTADVGQMMIVYDVRTLRGRQTKPSELENEVDREFQLRSGLTPPAKNIRTHRPKMNRFTPDEVRKAEAQVFEYMSRRSKETYTLRLVEIENALNGELDGEQEDNPAPIPVGQSAVNSGDEYEADGGDVDVM